MKQFTIEKRGERYLVIYPKHITNPTSEGPYLQIMPESAHIDRYEVVRAGHVRIQGKLWSFNEDEIDRSIRRILWLMRKL